MSAGRAWHRAPVQAMAALRRRTVFVQAASLFGSTAVTSILGFAFWVVAARAFPLRGVGVASAAIAAMQLLGTFGIIGMGTLLIGELSDRDYRKGMVSAAMLAAALACAALGAAYVALRPILSIDLGSLGKGIAGPLVFVAGVAATGAALVLDQAVVGLRRGDLQLVRNTVFSGVKLLLLPVAWLLGGADAALIIYGAWLIGNLVSLATFLVHARRSGVRPHLPPAFRSLAAVRRAAFAHHWLNLAAQAPRLALPVLVAATLTPELNAAFYTASLIVSFASIIPAHLSTALFALPKGDEAALAGELRSTLRVSAIVGLLSAAFFAVTAHLCLSVFGNGYVVASSSMVILGLTTLPYTVKVHYAAVCRVQGRLMWCAMLSTLGGLLEVAAAYAGARLLGLAGVSAGLLLALVLEAAVLWPAVAVAARLPPLPGRFRALVRG